MWQFQAKLVRVIDGDTAVFYVDRGEHIFTHSTYRIADVDCPEIFHGTDRGPGFAAKAFTQAWCDAAAASGDEWPFVVVTDKDKMTFARYVATITRVDTGESLGDALVLSGHAVPWKRK